MISWARRVRNQQYLASKDLKSEGGQGQEPKRLIPRNRGSAVPVNVLEITRWVARIAGAFLPLVSPPEYRFFSPLYLSRQTHHYLLFSFSLSRTSRRTNNSWVRCGDVEHSTCQQQPGTSPHLVVPAGKVAARLAIPAFLCWLWPWTGLKSKGTRGRERESERKKERKSKRDKWRKSKREKAIRVLRQSILRTRSTTSCRFTLVPSANRPSQRHSTKVRNFSRMTVLLPFRSYRSNLSLYFTRVRYFIVTVKWLYLESRQSQSPATDTQSSVGREDEQVILLISLDREIRSRESNLPSPRM